MAQKKQKKSTKASKEVGMTEQLLLLERMNQKAFNARLEKHVKKLVKHLDKAIENASARLETENSTEGMELIIVNPSDAETVPTKIHRWDRYETAMVSESERFAASVHGGVALVPELHVLVIRNGEDLSTFGQRSNWSSVETKILVKLHVFEEINLESVQFYAGHDNSTFYADTIRQSVEDKLVEPMVAWLDSLGVAKASGEDFGPKIDLGQDRGITVDELLQMRGRRPRSGDGFES